MKTGSLLIAALALAAGPAAAETWNSFSRSERAAYMADVDSIVAGEDGVTTIKLAIVPLRGEASDLSHTVDTYEIKCRSGEWRSPLSVEYGPDGAETGRYPDESDFERVRDGTVPGILKEFACDGVRSAPNWPSIQGFIEGGRGGGSS